MQHFALVSFALYYEHLVATQPTDDDERSGVACSDEPNRGCSSVDNVIMIEDDSATDPMPERKRWSLRLRRRRNSHTCFRGGPSKNVPCYTPEVADPMDDVGSHVEKLHIIRDRACARLRRIHWVDGGILYWRNRDGGRWHHQYGGEPESDDESVSSATYAVTDGRGRIESDTQLAANASDSGDE